MPSPWPNGAPVTEEAAPVASSSDPTRSMAQMDLNGEISDSGAKAEVLISPDPGGLPGYGVAIAKGQPGTSLRISAREVSAKLGIRLDLLPVVTELTGPKEQATGARRKSTTSVLIARRNHMHEL